MARELRGRRCLLDDPTPSRGGQGPGYGQPVVRNRRSTRCSWLRHHHNSTHITDNEIFLVRARGSWMDGARSAARRGAHPPGYLGPAIRFSWRRLRPGADGRHRARLLSHRRFPSSHQVGPGAAPVRPPQGNPRASCARRKTEEPPLAALQPQFQAGLDRRDPSPWLCDHPELLAFHRSCRDPSLARVLNSAPVTRKLTHALREATNDQPASLARDCCYPYHRRTTGACPEHGQACRGTPRDDIHPQPPPTPRLLTLLTTLLLSLLLSSPSRVGVRN